MIMRDFTPDDWGTYQGCNSEHPQICEATITKNGVSYICDVIRDADEVEIFSYGNNWAVSVRCLMTDAAFLRWLEAPDLMGFAGPFKH